MHQERLTAELRYVSIIIFSDDDDDDDDDEQAPVVCFEGRADHIVAVAPPLKAV